MARSRVGAKAVGMWTVYRDERLFPFSELLGDCENVVDFDPYANFVWLVGTVPCVSIQLTLSQFAWQCFVWLVGTLCVDSTDPFSMLRGSVSCGSGQLGMRSRVSFLADLLAMCVDSTDPFSICIINTERDK